MIRFGGIFLAGILLIISCMDVFPEPYFLAYSTRAAEQQLRNSYYVSDDIGGISRLAAIVLDLDNDDIIFVGQVVEGEKAVTLSDFAISLRSILVYGEYPLVSIDKTLDSHKNQKQVVRFEGGIEDTNTGLTLFKADLLLKKLALGLIPSSFSYLKESTEFAKRHFTKDEEHLVVTRFWFDISGIPRHADGGDVIGIREMNLCVTPQVMVYGGSLALEDVRDRPAEIFAENMTGKMLQLAEIYPEIARLRNVFVMTALATYLKGYYASTSPFKDNLDFWLSNYETHIVVPTPRECDILTNNSVIQKHRRTKILFLEGGVRIRPIMLALRDNDLSVLKEVVLKTRPALHTIMWRLPINSWNIHGYPVIRNKMKYDEDLEKVGCYLTRALIDPGDFSKSLKFIDSTAYLDKNYGQGQGNVKLAPAKFASVGVSDFSSLDNTIKKMDLNKLQYSMNSGSNKIIANDQRILNIKLTPKMQNNNIGFDTRTLEFLKAKNQPIIEYISPSSNQLLTNNRIVSSNPSWTKAGDMRFPKMNYSASNSFKIPSFNSSDWKW